jgi:VWFA-related protein
MRNRVVCPTSNYWVKNTLFRFALTAALSVWIVAVQAGAQAPDSAQTSVPTFHSDVNLVKVDVKVSRRDGGNVGDLNQSDFRVLDEGEPQAITHFARETDSLSLLLLLDVSGSMTRYLSALAATTRETLAQLHPEDSVGVMVFSQRTQVVQPFTSDFGAIQSSIIGNIYKRTTGEGTLINESLQAAAEYMKAQAPEGRHAILIVTDNQSIRYRTSDEDVLRAMSAANATLNAIVVGDSPGPIKRSYYTNPASTPPDCTKLAAATGGESMDAGNIGQTFKKIVERIRTRYSLHYSPPSGQAGTYRKIQVELTPEARKRHPDAIIEARAGYFVNR